MTKEAQAEIEAWRDVRVELRRDRRGVYGVGMVGLGDSESERHDVQFILRPDVQEEANYRPQTAFHPIPDMPIFRRTTEFDLIGKLVRGMQARAGFPHQQGHMMGSWWSEDAEQQTANRKAYWGRKRKAWRIVNALIGEAIEAAAPAEAVTAARRFNLRDRAYVYRAITGSNRALQLAGTFPALALALYGDFFPKPAPARDREVLAEARRLVEVGARLKCIADLMGVPLALRAVKPSAAADALRVVDTVREQPSLVHA